MAADFTKALDLWQASLGIGLDEGAGSSSGSEDSDEEEEENDEENEDGYEEGMENEEEEDEDEEEEEELLGGYGLPRNHEETISLQALQMALLARQAHRERLFESRQGLRGQQLQHPYEGDEGGNGNATADEGQQG